MTEVELRQQLARISASPGFVRSKSLNRLLGYLLEAHISRQSETMKEYLLGVEVFDRGPSFDPTLDNIVRVQAGNLRARLKAYYAGPGAADPIVIDLPPGGYLLKVEQFAAPPRPPQSHPDARQQAESPGKSHRNTGVTAVLVVLLIGALAAAWYIPRIRSAAPPSGPSVAVLPFSNLDNTATLQSYADGLTEEIIETLARIPGTNVTGRTSIWGYRDRTPALPEIREALHVDSIVEGSVRQNGNRIRIVVRLLASIDGSTRWSGEFEPERADIVPAQEQVARAVAAALKVNLAGGSEVRPRIHDPALYELCEQGRALWFKATPSSAHEAISLAAQVLVRDPNYAPAYVVMAGAYEELVFAGRENVRENWQHVKEMASKAIELDPLNAQAHTLLAGPLAWLDWDYPAAEAQYRRALELAPGDAMVQQYYASFLSAFGRFAEAEPHMSLARKLDPRNPLALWTDARLAYWSGDYRRANTALDRLRAEFPGYALNNNLIARVWPKVGRTAAAIELLEKAPRSANGLDAYGLLGYVYAQAGEVDKARQVARDLELLSAERSVPAASIAFVYAGLGDKAKAISALEKACDERSLRTAYMLVDPMFANLKGEPAFEELLRHTHLR